jgi:hypothetical protein
MKPIIQWVNPPNRKIMTKNLDYLTSYKGHWSYIGPPKPTETVKTYKNRIYETYIYWEQTQKSRTEMRIQRKYANVIWQTVWKNIHATHLPWYVRTAWYAVTQDILPTKDRLHTINLQTDNRCTTCQERDTVIHRITECTEAAKVWRWTQLRIARYMRTDHNRIPAKWTILPDYEIWPSQRHNATTWILGHMIWYTTQNKTAIKIMDYMRRKLWKTTESGKIRRACGNYLQVVD